MNEIIEAQHEAIKEVMQVKEVVEHFERLQKKGRNWRCKCPLHNENTPSFVISPTRNIYTCFGGCGSGDAIKFLMHHLKIDYIQAMKWLGDFYHMPVDETTPRTYTRPTIAKRAPAAIPPVQYIPKDIFNKTLTGYADNNFVKFLLTLFEPRVIESLLEKYYIGTSRHYPGAVVFWQIDELFNIRYGKVMGYNPETGKRIKQPFEQINTICGAILKKCLQTQQEAPEWVVKYEAQDTKPQCLFGLHLISEDLNKPIAIVESEKTALVGSIFAPDFIWLATGAKGYEKYNRQGGINEVPELLKAKFRQLAGRKVILFPDLGAVEDWQELAKHLQDIAAVTVSDLLSTIAATYQLPAKSDLCDFLTSVPARRELIETYKDALRDQAPQTTAEGWVIWEYFRDRGLRDCDRIQAHKEIIESGYFNNQSIRSNAER